MSDLLVGSSLGSEYWRWGVRRRVGAPVLVGICEEASRISLVGDLVGVRGEERKPC